MIFVFDISTAIVFILSCVGFAFASTALTLALEWLFSHIVLALIICIIVLVASALFKTGSSIEDSGSVSIITGFVFNLLAAGIELCFMLGYILPTWIYAGGFYAMGETVASIILFFIAGIIGKFIISFILEAIAISPCAARGIADFIAKGGTFIAFYFLLNGLNCYIFDFLGIKAPFI